MRTGRAIAAIAVAAMFLAIAGSAAASDEWDEETQTTSQGKWWITECEDELTSPYYDSIPYCEVAPMLREFEVTSERVKVEVMGESTEGRDLFLVTVADPDTLEDLESQQAFRELMVDDPNEALEMLDDSDDEWDDDDEDDDDWDVDDVKLPFYLHASIHGDEYPGVDASLELIETLAYSEDDEVLELLDNMILLVNVVANPDGRVHGIRYNGNGFDLNRDFVTLSQPETQATVEIFRDWLPTVVLDLHGFVYPYLIEPTTPPHNPSYEYDLYIKWAFPEAQAMEEKLFEMTGWPALIPFRDWDEGWDDWPPIFTPMYAMYHGSYGHTLETLYRDARGVEAHYWTVWGALEFALENKDAMLRDQIEFLRRGFEGLPQEPIPEEILEETPYEQYDFVIDFPEAYIIPRLEPWQQNPHHTAFLIDFLLYNGVEVEKANKGFTVGDDWYPKGTYIVWSQQSRRSLAHTLLADGWDISYDPGLDMYDISAWSQPLLWGVTRDVIWDPFDVKTSKVTHAKPVKGSVARKPIAAFAYLPTSNDAIRATNDLLERGVPLLRSTEPFSSGEVSFGTGTFILPTTVPKAKHLAKEIASRYGLKVYGLSSMPEAVAGLEMPDIAVHGDAGLRFVLRDLGFSYDVVTTSDLNGGIDLSMYDVFVHNGWWPLRWWLSDNGREAIISFVEDGGNYLGIGRSGADLAVDLGLSDVGFDRGGRRDNGIVRITYETEDLIAAQYPADGHAFVFGPVWFTSYGSEVEVSASFKPGEFFVGGWWPGWEASADYPVVLWHEYDDAYIVLMGIEPTFRAHPMHTYRLVANALYLS